MDQKLNKKQIEWLKEQSRKMSKEEVEDMIVEFEEERQGNKEFWDKIITKE